MTSLRVTLGVGIGLLLVVSLGVGVALWNTAHRIAATASRVIALSRFVEELQALDPALVTLTAVLELSSYGDVAFRDDPARYLRPVEDPLGRLGRQASALSATHRGFVKHLEQQWALGRTAILEFQPLLPDSSFDGAQDSSASRRVGLLEAIHARLEAMQHTGAALRRDCLRVLQQDASASAAWPRRVSRHGALLVGALLALGLGGLTLVLSLPWAQQTQALTHLRQQLGDVEQERAILQSQLQRAQADAQELRRAVTEKTDTLTQAQQSIMQLTSRCETLQAKLEEQQKEPQQVEASLKAVNEELVAAQKEVQNLTSALTEKTQALTEAQQAISKLQGRLGKQQAELTRRQEELAKLQTAR